MADEKSDQGKEIRIPGVPPSLYEEIRNISTHMGVTMPQLLRPKLREIADSYPQKYRQEPDKKN